MTVQTSPSVFSSEPQDICAVEGHDVFFPCEYNSTSVYSTLWRINGQKWSTSRLPPNHRLNARGLTVSVDTSFNQSTYSCIIRTPSMDDEIIEFESKTAVLTVVQEVSNTGIIIICHL